ncbi:MAG: type II secretion system protein, partial [Limisphaerales bacterium]
TTGGKASATRIKCVSNLKNIGLSFRIFATDNSDLFPQQRMLSNGVSMAEIDVVRVFGALSNEIADPKILICPADKERKAAASFTNLSARNISYFASLSAEETLPQAFLAGDRNIATNGVAVGTGLLAVTTNSSLSWTKELHVEQGDILMGDGSVQQMSSSRIKHSIRDQDLGTNFLVFP